MAREVEQPGDEAAELRRRLEVADRHCAVLSIGLADADDAIGALRAQVAELEARLAALAGERDERQARLAACELELAAVTASRSWRLTAPLRALRERRP